MSIEQEDRTTREVIAAMLGYMHKEIEALVGSINTKVDAISETTSKALQRVEQASTPSEVTSADVKRAMAQLTPQQQIQVRKDALGVALYDGITKAGEQHHDSQLHGEIMQRLAAKPKQEREEIMTKALDVSIATALRSGGVARLI